jgi:hypothetical protein
VTDLNPPPPPVGFIYDGSPDALAKIEHLLGGKRMRMIEMVEQRTQFNWRTRVTETASIPRPDPLTLDVEVDGDWVHVPIGARIEHAWNTDVTLMVSLGPAVHPIEWGELREPAVQEHDA